MLGVATNATEAEIRAAYKSLALKQHPDKVAAANRTEATAKFQQLRAAYDKCMEAVKNPRQATFDEIKEPPVRPKQPTPQDASFTPFVKPINFVPRNIEELLELERIQNEYGMHQPSRNQNVVSPEKRLALYRAQLEALKACQAQTPTERERGRSKVVHARHERFWEQTEAQRMAEKAEEEARNQQRDEATGSQKRNWLPWQIILDYCKGVQDVPDKFEEDVPDSSA